MVFIAGYTTYDSMTQHMTQGKPFSGVTNRPNRLNRLNRTK